MFTNGWIFTFSPPPSITTPLKCEDDNDDNDEDDEKPCQFVASVFWDSNKTRDYTIV